ncbi:MAG: hypothetical protein Tp138OMZ00d2C19078241_60 [Prokaryotic dsDNA virus sp.]|jgi:CHASE3 domain sensor protein|nr:MAG: hypothetical protein Tp138OMZ00d2C19078241_60 [Prokaryotic dsDNA virus sp.]|tara:strand:+ start:10326 stop:10571 length:246 start_codon:yes stop_codon:yes gene_type:complete
MTYESELSNFVQRLVEDPHATITMGQLQNLVNDKNAAQARIQELEAQMERLREILNTAVSLMDAGFDDEAYEIMSAEDLSE